MIIELGYGPVSANEGPKDQPAFRHVRAMVCESVGPLRHEVSVPFHDSQVRKAALLIQTGWDQYWGTEAYWEPGPFLAESLIFRMVRSGVRIVGVDFPVTGRSSGTQLVTSGKIPIVENLHDVTPLPRLGFYFNVVPIGLSAESVLPVRAFAEIEK
jgi:kynurenine formamidase